MRDVRRGTLLDDAYPAVWSEQFSMSHHGSITDTQNKYAA